MTTKLLHAFTHDSNLATSPANATVRVFAQRIDGDTLLTVQSSYCDADGWLCVSEASEIIDTRSRACQRGETPFARLCRQVDLSEARRAAVIQEAGRLA